MGNEGRYADGRSYEMPADWLPLSENVLDGALQRGQQAVTTPDAFDRLASYYNTASEYAGTSFLDVKPNHPSSVDAADLYAVSRLSITVTNLQGRLLLTDEKDVVPRTGQLLAAISPDVSIGDLTPDLLAAMWQLQHYFRTLLATETRQSNHWVFAAKLCARKRSALFPVRDSVVCRYLSGGQQLAHSAKHVQAGRLGWFSSDIQVFAYMATDDALRESLESLRNRAREHDLAIDEQPLRLLDVLLWTRGVALEAAS